MAEAQDAKKIEPRRKRGGLKLVVQGVLVLALAGGGYFYWRHTQTSASADSVNASTHAANKERFYQPLDPAFVVNFKGESTVRFLQIGVQLMAYDKAALDAAKANDPALRDALISLFSTQEAAQLASPEGKDKLRASTLEAVQKVVAAQLGRPGIEAVYFTSFVMQ